MRHRLSSLVLISGCCCRCTGLVVPCLAHRARHQPVQPLLRSPLPAVAPAVARTARARAACADAGGGSLRERAAAFARRFVPAFLFFLFVRQFVVEPFYIPSLSMYPTLTINDQIAVEKFSRFWSSPHRGDLVVFKAPASFFAAKGLPPPERSRRDVTLIKRVVAVGGDEVEVRGGALVLNGQPQYEPYTRETARYSLPKQLVPEGALFVLGDNRNASIDSHVWGCVPVENVVGKAFYLLYPVGRQGFVDELMQDLEVTGDASPFIERLVEPEQRPTRAR